MRVRTADHQRQRQAFFIGQQASFAAFFFRDPWDFCPRIPTPTGL
jgi:hypothetical protein